MQEIDFSVQFKEKIMNIETLRKDMVAAMKAKDKVKKDAISSLIAAVKKVAIDEGVRDDIPDNLVDKVILKELKSIKEQIDTCPDERAELKAEYMAKAAIKTPSTAKSEISFPRRFIIYSFCATIQQNLLPQLRRE